MSSEPPSTTERPWSRWTREQVAGIQRAPENVAPLAELPDERIDPDAHVWDFWLLRTRDGSVASVDGWRVLVALTAPADMLPGKRHDVATLQYYYSRDGREWQAGGRIFDDAAALGSRQWAGSALYDDGDVYLYYTAAGTAGESELTYSQRLAMASGGRLVTDDGGAELVGPWTHQVLPGPDGVRYETEEQTRGMIYTFRDPWFFEDPATGETCLLFEANVPVPEGADACGGDADQQAFNGCVGVATSPTGDPTDWHLQDPILDGVCVNQELERPQMVVLDGRYYLFVSSHRHTFAPGVEGPDGFYGFVADDLRGEYRPLNGSGLVATNPATAPFQSYSWIALAHREEVLVAGFLNYVEYDRPSLDDVADLPEREQRRRFGGTPAPTIRLGVDGDRTAIRGTLGYGEIPLAGEELPAAEYDPTDRPAAAVGDLSGMAAGRTGSSDAYVGSDDEI